MLKSADSGDSRIVVDAPFRESTRSDGNLVGLLTRVSLNRGCLPEVIKPYWRPAPVLGAYSGGVRAGFSSASQKTPSVLAYRPHEKKSQDSGVGYLMRSGEFYKIGRSNAAGRRKYEIAIQLPGPLRRIHTIRTDDPAGIEECWHERFAARRKKREWFNWNAAEVSAFSRRKFM
jgi:hypothetical protein